MSTDAFVARLNANLVPALKQQRFTGRFPRFTRSIGPLIHEVAISGARHGGERALTLGIGFHFLDGISLYQDGIEYYLSLTTNVAKDGWWRYNADSVADCEAKADNMIHCFHARSDEFFIAYTAFPEPFAKLTLHDLEFAPQSCLPPRPFRNVGRDCLVLMNMWHYLGDFDRAREFATAGMQHAHNAVTLKSKFEAYLATSGID
jgi:hypothetical protein